ncbi:MAG: hypothetical protein VR65_04455 [Desulfobulbaceae bacterium BRH_c16a]|nr:MAG: hypothetical protein VR65_04455 [Desulfobulbaceae bacterium BRH_c16a]
MDSPKVFISHSWDDKARFVLDFGKKLRARGIDAWIDEWEMMPGDSLVKKVFCEGIKNANAFLIVLSQNSVQKKWVNEELDLAVVKKLEEGTRIIPIIIDDCKIPEPLKSTVWVKINDLQNYHNELEKIVMAIFGQSDKPPLGSSPNYLTNPTGKISGLNEIDSITFNAIFEEALKQNKQYQIPLDQVFRNIKEYEIEKEIFNESLSILTHKHLIKAGPTSADITDYGVSAYINEKVPEFYEMEKTIIYELINKGLESKGGRIDFGGINLLYEHYILQRLNDQNLISYNRTLGNTAIIQYISPVLKRYASEQYN